MPWKMQKQILHCSSTRNFVAIWKKTHSNKYIIKFMITEIEATNGPKKNSKAIWTVYELKKTNKKTNSKWPVVFTKWSVNDITLMITFCNIKSGYTLVHLLYNLSNQRQNYWVPIYHHQRVPWHHQRKCVLKE